MFTQYFPVRYYHIYITVQNYMVSYSHGNKGECMCKMEQIQVELQYYPGSSQDCRHTWLSTPTLKPSTHTLQGCSVQLFPQLLSCCAKASCASCLHKVENHRRIKLKPTTIKVNAPIRDSIFFTSSGAPPTIQLLTPLTQNLVTKDFSAKQKKCMGLNTTHSAISMIFEDIIVV